MTAPAHEMDTRVINVIKGLVMDATRHADSGHPGGPMSSADMAYILYKEFLRFDPDDTQWFDRDRFVLSAGHESMLLYSLLLLRGELHMDDIKEFRQLGSRTPGHPEVHLTPGVEATTGPLGQGFSMSVGMAAAEAHIRARIGKEACNHFTYTLASDGDLQEPVALGSAALAGHWGLGRLIVLYDANDVQLAGPTNRADCTDYHQVFKGMCWHVQEIDGHDHDQIRQAIKAAQDESDRPSLIIGHTVMAKGSASMEGDFNAHGAPFSKDEIRATKKLLGLPEDEIFYLPDEAEQHFRSRFPDLRDAAAEWQKRINARLNEDSPFREQWEAMFGDPGNRTFSWPKFDPDDKIATRKVFGTCLEALSDQMPFLIGGSADLDQSNKTDGFREATGVFGKDLPTGRHLCFGVREFPMGGIVNGIALHGGLTPFGATFLTFSDYQRNAVRMSAIQKIPALHVYTHDSFYLGEDGPTHQSIEHTSSLRLIPDLLVLRPADARETTACLEIALKRNKRPCTLMLTRQGLPVLSRKLFPGVEQDVHRGGYILLDPKKKPEILFIATGSEVALALDTAKLLKDTPIRVVSMPCVELFEEQDQVYRDKVLPPDITRRVTLEAGATAPWYKYAGRCGLVVGIDHFGDSAPGADLAKAYGFTADQVASAVKEKIKEWDNR